MHVYVDRNNMTVLIPRVISFKYKATWKIDFIVDCGVYTEITIGKQTCFK